MASTGIRSPIVQRVATELSRPEIKRISRKAQTGEFFEVASACQQCLMILCLPHSEHCLLYRHRFVMRGAAVALIVRIQRNR